MMKRVLFFMVVLSVLSCQDSAVQPDEPGLLEALETFNQAFANADVETLDQMITSNYIHTNSNSKSFGREPWLNYLKGRQSKIADGTLTVQEYRLDDREIAFHGNTAIVTGKIVMSGVEDSNTFSREIRVTNIWVNEKGQWKRAGFHDTRIQ